MPTSGSIDTTTLTGLLGSKTALIGSISVPTSLGAGIYMNTLKPILDDELSETSENAVKNKVLYSAIQELKDQQITVAAISNSTIDTLFA